MIIITGAAGFIGSCMVQKLNDEGYNDLIVVDDFSNTEKHRNLEGKRFSAKIHRDEFVQWLRENHRFAEFVFHIGARTDTTEFDVELFNRMNLNYSKEVWKVCVEFGLPLVYASSAATYGNGEHGYDDDERLLDRLIPLNPYGYSKHDFDKWAVNEERKPYFWAGLKFFNVYGPNEYRKHRMASVVFHAYNQIQATGKVKLFRSHRIDYEDGMQLRDFIYVKDVVDVCYFLMHHRKNCGIYNLGTGKARPFVDLVNAIFKTLNLPSNIEFIDTPIDIRDTYQYFTQAKMDKLCNIGYPKPFYSLEDGVADYVQNYLLQNRCH